eukprot:366461-Chlamydomonas_euryale.AAC.1
MQGCAAGDGQSCSQAHAHVRSLHAQNQPVSLLPMHATSAAAERFNSTYGAMYTAVRSSLALGTDDKMARVHTMENLSRFKQTAQPEIVTMRLMELVDKSKVYLKRLRAANVAAPVAEGPTMRGRGRPRTN